MITKEQTKLKKVAHLNGDLLHAMAQATIPKHLGVSDEFFTASEELLRRYLLLTLIRKHRLADSLEDKFQRSRRKKVLKNEGKVVIAFGKQIFPTLPALLYCLSNAQAKIKGVHNLNEALSSWYLSISNALVRKEVHKLFVLKLDTEAAASAKDFRTAAEKTILDDLKYAEQSLLKSGIAQLRLVFKGPEFIQLDSMGVQDAETQNGFLEVMYKALENGHPISFKGERYIFIKLDSDLGEGTTGSPQPIRKGRRRKVTTNEKGELAKYAHVKTMSSQALCEWITKWVLVAQGALK